MNGASASQGGKSHAGPDKPSSWVMRFAGMVPAAATMLDVACGGGRHLRYFLGRGCRVVGVDIDLGGVADLRGRPEVELVQADLESGPQGFTWPFAGRQFDGVVVVNYLWRPLLPAIVDSVAPGGVLIYETFALGNERFGRPSNPAFLVAPGELLEAVRGRLEVRAYEHGEETEPRPSMRQRICAVNVGG
jgi:SAM-dependent methyltransferase